MVQAGQYVTDGTAVFLVTDIRDGAQVGDIKLSPVLRKGYVKANGALLTSARANYPRLVTFLTENPSLNAADDTAWNSNKALYVYNSSADTLRVPDATGRVLQGGASVQSVEAGLPNISGSIANIEGTTYSSGSTLSSGALYWIQPNYSKYIAQNNGPGSASINLNATLSNSIYGNATTVQTPALTMIPQIRY